QCDSQRRRRPVAPLNVARRDEPTDTSQSETPSFMKGEQMNKAQTSPVATEAVSHADMANAIRALSMDAVQAAKSGHPGMPMGMADVATVLFSEALRFSAASPEWPNRDRFVLSAGHGSMLLYSLLYLTGYPGMT